jgi:hypothetical protein
MNGWEILGWFTVGFTAGAAVALLVGYQWIFQCAACAS